MTAASSGDQGSEKAQVIWSWVRLSVAPFEKSRGRQQRACLSMRAHIACRRTDLNALFPPRRANSFEVLLPAIRIPHRPPLSGLGIHGLNRHRVFCPYVLWYCSCLRSFNGGDAPRIDFWIWWQDRSYLAAFSRPLRCTFVQIGIILSTKTSDRRSDCSHPSVQLPPYIV